MVFFIIYDIEELIFFFDKVYVMIVCFGCIKVEILILLLWLCILEMILLLEFLVFYVKLKVLICEESFVVMGKEFKDSGFGGGKDWYLGIEGIGVVL